MSSTTHFVRCVSRAEKNARGAGAEFRRRDFCRSNASAFADSWRGVAACAIIAARVVSNFTGNVSGPKESPHGGGSHMSSANHFVSCIRRAKTTARGFWAWLPMAPAPRVRALTSALGALPSYGVRVYGAAIIRAAERAEPQLRT
jgi:hypothetical protein